jgi:ADP-ribose pyrophosphatase YjhB (NUDIX family)
MKLEITAGGIVCQKTNKGIKIAFILDPYNKWAFAKGHVEKGEKTASAALRETQEEMGISDLKLIEKLGSIDLWFRQKNVLIHKIVYYFLMEAMAGVKTHPQRKEKIKAVKWVDLDHALEFASYKDIKPLLKKAIEILKRSSE